MVKTTLKIDGMACSMCESHVNDAIRRSLAVKKVISNHKKGLVEIISQEPLDEAVLRSALAPTGYKVLNIQSEPYEKKNLFGR